MPEGDSLHRAAARLQPLVGQRVAVETPHPRAAVLRIAGRLDGLVLERVEAVGKNLLLTFEGGVVLRSHLRMSGRWQLRPRGERRVGRPWLVLRGDRHEGVLWNGPVLEIGGRPTRRPGPDLPAPPPPGRGMLPKPPRPPRAAPAAGRRGGSVPTSSRPSPTSKRCSRTCACSRGATSATRSSTSASSPGSGTCGRPRASGARGSRRG